MKRLSVVAIATFMAGTASAAIPVFRATCPADMNVDADRTGTVFINGNKVTVNKFNDNYYQAKHSGVTISISLDPDGTPMVNYTGKHGANGVCQVADFIPAGSHTHASADTSSMRAGQGHFDATGNISCAQHKRQPMGQCHFGVARNGNGSATVVVTRPDGRKRAIFFENGKATGADLSQADGNMNFHARKEADFYTIRAGDERYEIPDVVISGD